MNGIVTDGFESILKKNSGYLSEIKDDVSNIKNSCSDMAKNLGTDDLSFLKNKINKEIEQLEKALNKFKGYQQTLTNVCAGYKSQYNQNVEDLHNLISQ